MYTSILKSNGLKLHTPEILIPGSIFAVLSALGRCVAALTVLAVFALAGEGVKLVKWMQFLSMRKREDLVSTCLG